jgi:LmbE family N-acetylglucosaminyl deacetylase
MTETIVEFTGVAGGQNLLVLAAEPGDESRYCAGLITQACRRGRPPFIAVLTDGSSAVIAGSNAGPDAVAAQLERASRAAIAGLGVPADWFLMLGLLDGTAPMAGRKFEAVVAAVALIMWRRDCNVLVAPWAADPRPDYAACHAMAWTVAARTGVGLVTYPTGAASAPAGARRLAGTVSERYFPLEQPDA